MTHFFNVLPCCPSNQRCPIAGIPQPLANPGEEEYASWDGEKTMSLILPEAARTGNFGLRVVDNSTTTGSELRQTGLAVKPESTYALQFWARSEKAHTVGVYLIFLDEQGKHLNRVSLRNEICLALPKQPEWYQFTLVAKAPAAAQAVTVRIHSFNAATGVADLDDFTLLELTAEEAKTMRTTFIRTNNPKAFPAFDPDRVKAIASGCRLSDRLRQTGQRPPSPGKSPVAQAPPVIAEAPQRRAHRQNCRTNSISNSPRMATATATKRIMA